MNRQTEQGSTSTEALNAAAIPIETLLKRFQSFKPPTLTGTESAIDCENWLEDIEQLFEALDYTDDRRVKLIIHQLHGIGKSWWVATKKALENQGTVITWAVFRTAFYQRFFPVSYRKDKGAEFANLRQGQLNIEDSVAKFTSLLKFAPHVAISDEAQADQFINGLNPDVFTYVNTGRPNTFADALNRAKGAEAGLLRQRRAQFVPAAAKSAQENPQIPPPPRFDAGSSSGKKKNFFKGKGKQFKRSGTSSSSSSSEFKQLGAGQKSGDYCTKCGGRHATEQCRGVSGLCRICNQPGHFARICPQRNSGNFQNSEAARTMPIPERQASSVYSYQPQHPQQSRQGGSQTVSQPPKQQARVFALTEEQAQAAPDDVIAGNCYLCKFPAYVLIDTGASHTFISENFVISHKLSAEPLAEIVSVSSPLGKGMLSITAVRNCVLQFEGHEIEIDCVVLGLSDFDCIVVIDMLTKYRATVDCFQKMVRFKPEKADEWKFYGKGSRARIPLVSAITMNNLLRKGAEGFLIYAIDTKKSSPNLVDIPVVYEFADVFPDEIPGLPPFREVEFSIELMPGTQPISKAPYRRHHLN
ncbi:hypothetical protein F511_12247 [Dorcoceras hygrometricum]|uniref:CCHC-type domain-containing protein n=1 Tax=Dorcoceras hygrometricum TaxID=472368 RepID=A0A2Z7A4F1_9LAMI|nr:hypothetical protein F511_12247 [Dorcoceras hygrometricum]